MPRTYKKNHRKPSYKKKFNLKKNRKTRKQLGGLGKYKCDNCGACPVIVRYIDGGPTVNVRCSNCGRDYNYNIQALGTTFQPC